MQDLLADEHALGTIRQKVVNISGTTYLPTQVPVLLEEMFGQIIDKAKRIKNPIESAFFLWVNLAYLQPFEDGNKRTSRLSANIPLMLYNCAPLSFIDVDAGDYALAMLGVYEQRDASLAIDLFEWAYQRSISRYAVTLDSMGVPNKVRLGFRAALTEAIGHVVRDRMTAEQAILSLAIAQDQEELFRGILMDELAALGMHNFARYRLGMKQTEDWIAAGRPQ
jgi:Fic family protein